jgi:hypothetical protein
MRFRRTFVTGALSATLILAGASAAVAAGNGNAHGQKACTRVNDGTSTVQRQITRLENRIQRLSDGGRPGIRHHRLDQLQAHKAKAEQKLQSLQTDCKA